jgi:surface protein
MTKLLLTLLWGLASLSLTEAQGRNTNAKPLSDTGIRQAVELWMGTDHNRAEITGLIGHISDWDTSQVTSFNSLFKGQAAFDEDLSAWNTSSVTDIADMFNGCSSFQGKPSLELWDTSKVTTMARMFKSATLWEGDLSSFDTSSVTDMSYMFQVRGFCRHFCRKYWEQD